MSPKTGVTHMVKTGCGKMYCTINEAADRPIQFLTRIGRSGTCARCQVDSQRALIDLAIRKGVTPEEIIEALQDIRCHQSNEAMGTRSCPDAIAESFRRFLKDRKAPKPTNENEDALLSEPGSEAVL